MALTVSDTEIHTSPGRTRRGSLHVSGSTITAHPDRADRPMTIDGAGATVVPLLVDTVFASETPPAGDAFDLVPGRPASFAVVAGSVSASSIRTMLVVRPRDLIAVVVHGKLVAEHGRPVRSAKDAAVSANDSRVGAWTDPRRDMTQYLGPDGRYTETRSGRRDAWTGAYWLDEDRITYLDDTGFWAFGQYHHGILHHAGFVLRREHPGHG